MILRQAQDERASGKISKETSAQPELVEGHALTEEASA
jgi:hypothetical protein